jgi:hypothetical protein
MTFARFIVPVLLFAALVDPSFGQSRRGAKHPAPATTDGEEMKNRLNAWTVGLAGGLFEGAPIRFATEIARVLNDGDEMHVLPIVTRGRTENVNNLLYLKGVDAAIINGDALEEYKSQVRQIQERITYILNLFPSELHIFVRSEINALADPAGKKVNFNTQGTATAHPGSLIFSRLGIDVEKMFIPHPVALEKMRNGEIDAVVLITTKPLDVFVKRQWDEGFKFLPVEYGPKFQDYYLASNLEHADYPNLIGDQRIASIAVPIIPASYNWRPDSPRYLRIARFTDKLFGGIDKLGSPGFDPKWKDVSLTAKAAGLERFRVAQKWLDQSFSTNQGAHP